MPYVTDLMVREIIDALPDDFDSHKLIRLVMQRHPQQYVRDLYDNVSLVDPIQSTHAEIGRRLNRFCLEKKDRVASANVRNEDATENQGWHKFPTFKYQLTEAEQTLRANTTGLDRGAAENTLILKVQLAAKTANCSEWEVFDLAGGLVVSTVEMKRNPTGKFY